MIMKYRFNNAAIILFDGRRCNARQCFAIISILVYPRAVERTVPAGSEIVRIFTGPEAKAQIPSRIGSLTN